MWVAVIFGFGISYFGILISWIDGAHMGRRRERKELCLGQGDTFNGSWG